MSENDSPNNIIDGLTLPEILNRGQSENCHFLSKVKDNDIDVAKVCAGIANHMGGIIVLGVDQSGAPCGFDPDFNITVRLMEILEEHTSPVPTINTDSRRYDGHFITIVKVEQYSDLPHAVTWKGKTDDGNRETYYVYYKRRDTVQRQLSPHELWRLMTDS